MVSDPCLTIPTICRRWDLQSPAMQRYLLLQLLNYVNGLLGGTRYELSVLKEAGNQAACQGSPALLQLLQAEGIVELLPSVDQSQPVCWTPIELEGAIAYIMCKILAGRLV